MDTRQYKTLRTIQKAGLYDYTVEGESVIEVVHFLAKSGYVVYLDSDSGKQYCSIKEEGRAALYDWQKERRRWFIPIIVSLFAAIGGYREELHLLLQATAKLWRTIMGG